MSSDAGSRDAPRPGRGEIFIVSAPSGAGKSTLIAKLLDAPELAGTIAHSVSSTTRRPRPGERDGEHYHFLSRERFRARIGEGAFLEWAEVHGELYGTGRDELFAQLDEGIDAILDIDVQGARQVMAKIPEARGIFILPPSYGELCRRLEERGSDPPEQIERRLREAALEVRACREYPYVIINDDVDRASRALAAIVLSRRQRRGRLEAEIAEVLRDFPPAPGSR